MYLKRIEKVRKFLRAKKADSFLLISNEGSGQPGTQYLSGFSGSSSVLFITRDKQFIITDGRYYTQARKEAPLHELVLQETKSALLLVRSLIEKFKTRSVLIDGTRTTHALVERMRVVFPKVKIINENNLLEELRVVKDVQEIRLIKKAADIAERAFLKLKPFIRSGISEKWLAAKLDFLMRVEGADRVAFDTIIASGKNGALPHAQPTDKKLKKGELVVIDFGAYYRGYASDIARTVAIGKISNKLREMYEVVKTSQALGCKAARGGITGAVIDKICRSYVEKNGYGKYFLHATGHGLGMEVHELPYVSSSSKKKLPVGAVITCEPGIYIEGLGGVRVEDDLYLTRNGATSLSTKIRRELMVFK